ncbi:MAG: hypothetical protein EXR02_07810 [Rhodospirillales bacterium]|nr:hypothetical protein [Rhodospirillales bacterium]
MALRPIPYGGLDYRPEVQGAAAGTGVLLGGAEFSYEQGRRGPDLAFDTRREQRSAPQSWSLIQVSSETFARILESVLDGGEGGLQPGSVIGSASRRFQDVIARAIATYENNAKLIHGETVALGGAVSIRL